MSESFLKILATARTQVKNGINKTARRQVTFEQFVELFKVRGYQTLLENNNSREFVIDNNNVEVIRLMYAYISFEEDKVNPNIGMILNGKWGCGKSILISTFCKVLNDLSQIDTIEVIHSIELAEQIRINGVLPYIHKPLCIQDIGKEPIEVTTFGTKINPVTNLLAIRAEYGVLTFGSTNMDFAIFEKTYQEFIAKRINDYVQFVLLKGESRRKNYSINQPKING